MKLECYLKGKENKFITLKGGKKMVGRGKWGGKKTARVQGGGGRKVGNHPVHKKNQTPKNPRGSETNMPAPCQTGRGGKEKREGGGGGLVNRGFWGKNRGLTKNLRKKDTTKKKKAQREERQDN